MTKDSENIRDGCKQKGNNLFLFIVGRTEVTEHDRNNLQVKKRKKGNKENFTLE